MPSIVALDIETTGLDPNKDQIIEIGAVRFNDRRIEAEWSTLVNPGRAIPEFITGLTGITNAMVHAAPPLSDVLHELDDFAADLPILGHNVSFDLSFLRKAGLFQYSQALDTYAMASVLMPNAGRYNLGALAQQLGILLPATHRALDDTKVTHAVYTRLYEKALELPVEIVADIVRLGDQVNWGAEYIFRNILKEKSKDVVKGPARKYRGPLFDSPPLPPPSSTLTPEGEMIPLDIEEVSSNLERGGSFSKSFEHFEHRPEQVELCQSIAASLSEGIHLLAEAGTGTGKSLAYLFPSALWALQNNTRVVISTNTINLQDQLIKKDIPDIQKILGPNLRASVLKGRNNYLCPRRLDGLRKKGPENADEMRMLAKMMIWLSETEVGDLSDVNINGPAERAVWNRISSSSDGCTGETCSGRMGGICPFHRARQAAQEAHILIVNHALLLADVATGNRVLPDYQYLIVDEGHHLEAASTSALSFRVTQYDVERTIRELGGTNSGNLGRMLVVAQGILNPGHLAALTQIVNMTTDQAVQFQNTIKQYFTALLTFLEDQREGRQLGVYSQQVRILPATRTQPAWLSVEIAWEDTLAILKSLLSSLEEIGKSLSEMSESGLEDIEDLISNFSTTYRQISEYERNINGLVFEPIPDQVYWVEINPRSNRVSLEAAPIHIGQLMEKHLWHEKTSIIVTSATLTTNGSFDYIRERLNAHDADELYLGSPFDYENSTLLYIPDNIPEPSDRRGHQRAVERSLAQLCAVTGGRSLILFTSYAQLKSTAKYLSPILNDQGIMVYVQGQGASPHTLVENFKASEQAVLLGTRSFWEGVDIPGESLSVLGLIKIPFAVPSEPIVAARGETFEQPFYQYSIPEAILTFRQGFGRLIRSHQDRGIVAVYDKRILTKQYGKMFIDSLPQCTLKMGPVHELPKAAEEWLGI